MADRPTKTTVTGRYIGGGLFVPRADPNNPEKMRHSACIVLDEGEPEKVEAVVKQAIADKWGGKPPAGLQVWGVREGDDPEYEASYDEKFINPKSTKAPKVLVRTDGVYKETGIDDGTVYPGCYVAASVEAYGYDGSKKDNIKPGVSLNLRAVLFRKDGERLDDYMDADSEFGGVEAADPTDVADDFLDDSKAA